MAGKHHTERRKSPRYAIKDDVYLTFRPNFDRVGRVQNISTGGATFEYVQYSALAKTVEVEVDIFSQEHFSFGGIETRRCGLKFKKLSEQQRSDLNCFLADLPEVKI